MMPIGFGTTKKKVGTKLRITEAAKRIITQLTNDDPLSAISSLPSWLAKLEIPNKVRTKTTIDEAVAKASKILAIVITTGATSGIPLKIVATISKTIEMRITHKPVLK